MYTHVHVRVFVFSPASVQQHSSTGDGGQSTCGTRRRGGGRAQTRTGLTGQPGEYKTASQFDTCTYVIMCTCTCHVNTCLTSTYMYMYMYNVC